MGFSGNVSSFNCDSALCVVSKVLMRGLSSLGGSDVLNVCFSPFFCERISSLTECSFCILSS